MNAVNPFHLPSNVRLPVHSCEMQLDHTHIERVTKASDAKLPSLETHPEKLVNGVPDSGFHPEKNSLNRQNESVDYVT